MKPHTVLLIGTRSSTLALRQTEWARKRLLDAGHGTERVDVHTTGDMIPDVPLSRIGGRAIFTKQIDDAMLERKIDLAVHSLKDLPTTLPDGIVIAAVAEREDPADAVVGRQGGPVTWETIPMHGVVATGSVRRKAQLLHVRPDLEVVDLRGNVDTRLRKLDGTEGWSAVVLAAAGLIRLGLEGRIGQRLPPEVMLPAPGQGALALTARSGDAWAMGAAREAVHHAPTALAVAAERAFLRTLQGGCQVPVAALATVTGGTVELYGRVVALAGDRAVEGIETGPAADEAAAAAVGTALAERLLDGGAGEILAAVRAGSMPSVPEP
jgi:hydroxymethylbilane synthase